MKDKLLSLKFPGGGKTSKLKRQGSTKSLAIGDFGQIDDGFNKRGSISSLTSLGFSSPFKTGKKGKDDEDEDYSFDDKGTMKKRFTKRLSSLFEPNHKLGANSESRRNSYSTVSLTNSIGSVSLSPPRKLPEAQLLQLEEEPDIEIPSVRGVQRRDILVCWVDPAQVRPTKPPRGSAPDLLSRLYNRVFTRHLVRLLLSYMEEDDFNGMLEVSKGWANMIRVEVPGQFLPSNK